MRSHPVAGIFCLILGGAFFVAGAFGSGSAGPLARLPLPPDILVPFIMWQLAVWSILFGFFFLRARGRYVTPKRRSAWSPIGALRVPTVVRRPDHVPDSRP